MQQLVRDLADRLIARPAIQLLGTLIPVSNDVVHIANDDSIMDNIEEVRLLLQCTVRRPVPQGKVGRDANSGETGEKVDKGDEG